MFRLHAITLPAALFLCALASSAQDGPPILGVPTSGSYTPPALSLDSLLASDKTISEAKLAYAQSGDSTTFRRVVQSAAVRGNLAAELLLAEQYIPEQCAQDPDHDVPNCGAHGKHNPKAIFGTNSLDVPASYEDACEWLERASGQGSGEASEVLAQLITRMLSNGHPTTYTAADSTRLHALARSQGFDVEPISVSCFQLTRAAPESAQDLTFVAPQRRVLSSEPMQPFSADELQLLEYSGAHGTLHFQATTSGSESVLLSRPAGPPATIRIILDHLPSHEIHLPIPAHHDVIYLQRADDVFTMLPSDVPILPRSLAITPQRADEQQVAIYIQQMSGAFSGSFCARF